MPLPFNKTLDLKLIKAVKENPNLYNTKHSKYLDYDSREVVWQKIGDSLNRPAVEFAGIQCQIDFGDYQEKKHKPGFIENLQEYLPEQYSSSWGIEKKIMKAYSQHQGMSALDAKFLYIKTARALPTYGVTFFLVKEKQKDKKKLVPRLLGINAEAILRLDEVTKEILQQWPLTHVKTYHAGKSQTFTLNFGDYSDKEYSVKTQDCHRIRDILEAYIDIIRRRMLAKPCADPGESMTICQDDVQMGKGNLIELVSNNPSKIVTESFVGPTRLLPYDQGAHAQTGTTITTVQQIVVTDHLQNKQEVLKGEIPLRGDMPTECIKKLNRMNSNSVKVVGLLTDPSDSNVEDAQKIVQTMQEDLPIVEKGIKETAEKQAIDDAKKMLLDELHDLKTYMDKLAGSTSPGHVDPNAAKEAAEMIADLTTQMYFSIDPKTRRRSELLRRSRKSLKQGEKTEDNMRRASFIAAATTALHAVDTAVEALDRTVYCGPEVDDEQKRKLERSLEDKMGKLNAAIALFLTAHSDPNNIDYSAAINSMNAINELMPKLARDSQMVGSTMPPAVCKELQDDMRTLFEATKDVCRMTGTDDHEKMQEAANQYADIAGKLIYTFGRGNNSVKENEIIQLAKQAGEKASQLLVTANELTCQARAEPAAALLDSAGTRTARACRDLLACAQLTAPVIHEPHCQSALTAAAEGVSSSVHQMETSWRPLVEHPTRQHMAEQLHTRAMDVMKALDRLRDAYGSLGDMDDADNASLPLKERQRLKFITSLSGAKSRLLGVDDVWDKSASCQVSDQDKNEAQRRLEQQIAQLNAAVAALAAATADRENPDYATAELAMSTISQLMPQIVKDTEIVSSEQDEASRRAALNNLRALCEAARDMCEGSGHLYGHGVAASKFAAASGKLVFLISPGADKGKEKYILELSSLAHGKASELVSEAERFQEHLESPAAAELASRAHCTQDAAQALLAVAQVTAPSISSSRCEDALTSAAARLGDTASELTATCHHQLQLCPEMQHQTAAMLNTKQQLDDILEKIAGVCRDRHSVASGRESSGQQDKQRLQFVKSVSGATQCLDAAAALLTKPMRCHAMSEENTAVLEDKLSKRLARLNAAVAALTAATADRDNPDYAAADKAVSSITEYMPLLIEDSRQLCSGMSEGEQASMLQDLAALCDATRQLCDTAALPQGVGDAAAKYSAASSKLVFRVTPGVDNAKENEVIGVAASACSKASELLTQVQQLTQHLEASAAAQLDRSGAATADAVQALLTVAQVTGSSIGESECQQQLLLAAERVRTSASQLTSACTAHAQHHTDLQQQLYTTHHELNHTLDKLVQACKDAQLGTRKDNSSGQKEKRRLMFVNSLSGVKNRVYDAEQQLKQPVLCTLLAPEDAMMLERKLSQRLAQLNAAIAALAAANADTHNPDYPAADRAVKDISELMPQIVQDSRKLCGTKDEADRAAMLEDLRALCQASRELCENMEAGKVIDTTGFKGASSKMVYLLSPGAKTKEKQVMELAIAACNKASDQLSLVQQLAALQQLSAPRLTAAATRLQEDAGALYAVAQVTSPSISEPSCSSELTSAAERVRGSSSELTSLCSQHHPDLQEEVTDSQELLQHSLNELVQACQEFKESNVGHKEKQQLKFISSVSGAKTRLEAAEQHLTKPLKSYEMKPEDKAAMESKLSERLAQLNAAIAALAAATADRENPDYAAADQAVTTISELLPQLVQESHTLSSTKTDDDQAAMLKHLRALCEATREICDNAGHPQGLSDAAAKYSAASGKLVYLISAKPHDAQEKQVTAPSISEPSCSEAVISSAERLRASSSALTSWCGPHLEQLPETQHLVFTTQLQLDDHIDKLVHACNTAAEGNLGDATSEHKEQQRVKFVNSVAGAKSQLEAAQQQLKKPMETQVTPQDATVLQHKLSERLAQLNAAIAALTAATADRENADYDTAHRSIDSIVQLMPQIVQDSRAFGATMDGANKAALSQDTMALCEAARDIYESVGQPQGLTEAAAKYAAASGKLVTTVSRKPQTTHEKQVVALSAASCGKASELLTLVQRLTEQLQDSDAAAELDRCGARTADAAQALLSVAQVTGSSIEQVECQKSLLLAAERVRTSASQLTSACTAHAQHHTDLQQQLYTTHHELNHTLDKLVQACKDAQFDSDVTLSPQQEKQRLKFVTSLSGARNRLDVVQQELNEPILCQSMRQSDGAALQHQLSRKLAQLNAAIAALAAATSDGKNPDYPAAERAVTTITELMPQVVQESRVLCGSREGSEQAAVLQQLRALCDASRDICHSAGQPKRLHEASARLANASGKLIFIVSPEQSKQQHADVSSKGSKPAVPVRKPAVPARDSSRTVAHDVPASRKIDATRMFLDTLRNEEIQSNSAPIVGINAKSLQSSKDEEKYLKQFIEMIDNAERDLHSAEQGLKSLYTTKSDLSGVTAEEVVKREQHMEDTLARAGVEVASLVAANYADKLDYKAAMEPTMSLTQSVKSIVDDASVVCISLPENARKPFIDDLTGLCQATKSICVAAKSKKEKLNDAAISFGDQSAKLLRVVSSDVNPALEKEVISRAKAIGDTASRLAVEAGEMAGSSGDAAGDALVQDICAAGTRCLHAAGKLVYTAKLVAPTIHHSTCQDTLVSSSENLSSALMTFSNTWAPLATSNKPNVQKLTEEARHLEELVEKLRKDIRGGKFGKWREVRAVNVDTPLRQMAMQTIDTATTMAEHGELTAELKQQYIHYSERLEEAIRALDVATARYQRAPRDKNKREEMEMASQDLQVTLLQTRPSRAGQEQSNIVDFRDFLQDLMRESDQLQKVAEKNEGPAGKKTVEDIKLLCTKINEDASRLLNPPGIYADDVTIMNSADDVMDIGMFGQECEVLIKEMEAAIQGVKDQKARQALRAKLLHLKESCNLLRFATYSHILGTRSAAYMDTLQNLHQFKTHIMEPLAKTKSRKQKKVFVPPLGSEGRSRRARSALLQAAHSTARGEPAPLVKAVAYYAAAAPSIQYLQEEEDPILNGIENMVHATDDIMKLKSEFVPSKIPITRTVKTLTEVECEDIKTPVLNVEDITKLLHCEPQYIGGTFKQLEDKLQQLASKLSSTNGTVVLGVKSPEALSRCLPAAADIAVQLANTARAFKDRKKPVQCKKIEDAVHEMCYSTYNLLKTSELVCQDPNHHDARRKLMEASRHLNDSINTLVRQVNPSDKVRKECGEAQRLLQLQRSTLQATPQPCGALPYKLCVDTLRSQRDVLHKLNSEQAMSREEFFKSMNYIVSAVGNSADCAAHTAYLLSVSEKDPTIAKEGIVDVSKLHNAIRATEDTCMSLITVYNDEQIEEDIKILKGQVKDLLDTLDDSIQKTKKRGKISTMLEDVKRDIQQSSTNLFSCNNLNDKNTRVELVTELMEDVDDASNLLEHPELVPTAREISADTQRHVDEILKNSLALVTHTEELIKQVKATPEGPETMKWVMFNKRKDVLDAFEAMLKSVKTSGQRANLLEKSEDSQEEKKSYVQKQFETASKWLLKSISKPEVKTNGQQAVRNLIEVANKVAEDLKGNDKEDMRHLVVETEQLLTECSKKYDHEQYSVLMERVRELKKGIERGVVTRVVEDFMEAEAPLADLDIVADHEKDESKRQFLLEKKIAELLAQLSRVTKTARLIADTDRDTSDNVSTQLNQCSEQAELLAPMLVKAAQQRVASPDDKVVIEHYKALLAQYAESLSKIRDLCDQSVDPMDFVQTAGVTMERMREESAKHNDPMKCAHTSAAITKLANRVIHVGMWSAPARRDPELARALADAQHQLRAAHPLPGTRDSKMPSFHDTTAKILKATEKVESLLGGETIFENQPGPNQPIYNEALNLHVAIREWSSRDNEIVAVAKRMAVLMAKLSNFMNNDKQHEVLATSKAIVSESHEVARLANKLAHECTDYRIKTNLLQTCERIPTISGQLKMLTTVKGFSLGRHGTQEDKEAMDMLVGNAQSLMLSIQDVVKGAASASVKIMSQRGPRMKWVRKNYY